MRVWRAAPDEAPALAELLAAFRDHLGYDGPSDASILASVERIIGRDDAEYLLAGDGEPSPRRRWSAPQRVTAAASSSTSTPRTHPPGPSPSRAG